LTEVLPDGQELLEKIFPTFGLKRPLKNLEQERRRKQVMAKIIRLDSSKKPFSSKSSPRAYCEHKRVIAYTAYRTVQCTSCGAALDPFDVLVDIIKGYVPPDGENSEQRRFEREVKRREDEEGKDD
jgi:hypothetical protein